MTDHEREIENLQLLVDTLRDELTERIHMCDMRSEKILELTDERDEARREACRFESRLDKEYGNTNPKMFGPSALAACRGWDCFKDNK